MRKSNLLLTGFVAAVIGTGSSYLVNKSFDKESEPTQSYQSFGDLNPVETNFNKLENFNGGVDFSDVAGKAVHGVVHIVLAALSAT